MAGDFKGIAKDRKAAKDSKKASEKLYKRLAKKITDEPRQTIGGTSMIGKDANSYIKMFGYGSKATKGKGKIKRYIKKGDMVGLQKFRKNTRKKRLPEGSYHLVNGVKSKY